MRRRPSLDDQCHANREHVAVAAGHSVDTKRREAGCGELTRRRCGRRRELSPRRRVRTIVLGYRRFALRPLVDYRRACRRCAATRCRTCDPGRARTPKKRRSEPPTRTRADHSPRRRCGTASSREWRRVPGRRPPDGQSRWPVHAPHGVVSIHSSRDHPRYAALATKAQNTLDG